MSTLTLWTIYGPNTADHPGHWVVRAWDITSGVSRPRRDATLCASLIEARAAVPAGLFRIDRGPGEDPVIVESWV